MRIAQSPEGRRIFPRMTVLENLQMGASLDNLRYFDEDADKVFQLFPRHQGAPRTSAAARCRAANSRCCRSAAR